MSEQEEFFSPKHKQLLSLAIWTKYVASLALVTYIFLAVSVVFQKQLYFQQIQAMSGSVQGTLDYWEAVKQEPLYYLADIGLDIIQVLLRGLIYFVVLRGVSLGLNMIVETDINYRERESQAVQNE